MCKPGSGIQGRERHRVMFPSATQGSPTRNGAAHAIKMLTKKSGHLMFTEETRFCALFFKQNSRMGSEAAKGICSTCQSPKALGLHVRMFPHGAPHAILAARCTAWAPIGIQDSEGKTTVFRPVIFRKNTSCMTHACLLPLRINTVLVDHR